MSGPSKPQVQMAACQPSAAAQPVRQQHTVVRVQKNCRQLFILYQGLAGRMMMDPLQFLHEARLTDRNLVMIRDRSRAYYQQGLGPDVPNLQAFEAWQRHWMSKLPHAPDLYCVGSSSGAYAALLCGHWLKAKEVFAFAPPTNLAPLLLEEKIECADRRYLDLKSVLTQGNGVTKYHIYYNESSVVDRDAAHYLKECPGVELHPEGGTGHGVIIHLNKIGKLQTLMPAFVPAV